jgi:hypothetical protein
MSRVTKENLIIETRISGRFSTVVVLGSRVRSYVEEDFLHIYPIKTIFELNGLVKDGTFVAFTIGFGIMDGDRGVRGVGCFDFEYKS